MLPSTAGRTLIEEWRRRAKGAPQRIALADGDDPRVAQAARELADEGEARTILIGDPERIRTTLAALGGPVAGLAIRSSEAERDVLADAALSAAAQAGRELTPEAADELVRDPVSHAALLVRTGQADAALAGSMRATSHVLRAAIRIIRPKPGVSVISSSFLMVLPDGRALAYGDCGVVPAPTAEALADIAIATADTFNALTARPPIVAMLSFSTKGSAEHSEVQRVRDATRLARDQRPDLAIDGELQFDAAFSEEVARTKAPGSGVAGSANVFIFPNLDAGNIAYKITQRLGGASAFGPLLQGLQRPMNDLSRGCSAEDVRNVGLVSAIQAAADDQADQLHAGRP